jgi:threonine/homoserine/homoserine lactone efflux protein
MTSFGNLMLFLGSVATVSLTGVMMPGPVTAITVTKGSQYKIAGALIAVGHGMVEFPLIAIIYLGFARFLGIPGVKMTVGLAGGLVLIWMAAYIFRTRPTLFNEHKNSSQNCVVAGLATTAANPYFFLWWTTVGAVLIANARIFGSMGIIALGVTHWLCDLGWLYFVSWLVFRSKQVWTERVHRLILSGCAVVLAGFGAWFIFSSINLAIAS